MAKLRTSGKKKNGSVKLKIVVAKLQKSLSLGKRSASNYIDELEDLDDSTNVPNDVKKGHFAVIAVDDNELKRFVVPLSYLTHPSFLRLLEQAAEEYGFDHEGALTIPCRPEELQRILAEQWVEERQSRDGAKEGPKTLTSCSNSIESRAAMGNSKTQKTLVQQDRGTIGCGTGTPTDTEPVSLE
ncbi:hypothetical protein F0562_022127 [Nyssa sinensis]|uniref:Uncharacterized protein n=1 Tax=Nyssa sinensis TaxID=561372 RepID=A0A5J5BLV9_9ASTE|nr:hypothetical protein F0562_022127 [Nyssa sinensis]